LPLLGGSYILFVATNTFVFGVAGVGMNVLVGYTGQISIGHGAAFGVGAYAVAILTVNHGWSPLAAVGLAILVGAAVGAIMSIPAMRLSEWYLAVITLAFGLVAQQLFLGEPSLTGGGAGLVGIPPIAFAGYSPTPRQLYILCGALLAVLMLLAAELRRSRVGRTLVAIKGDELMASSVGMSVAFGKFLGFSVSGALVGLAGGIWATVNVAITPDSFDVTLSLSLLLIVLIGGEGRLLAPLLGAVVFEFLPTYISGLSKYQEYFYGALLLAVGLFSGGGIVGLWDEQVAQRLSAWRMSSHAFEKQRDADTEVVAAVFPEFGAHGRPSEGDVDGPERPRLRVEGIGVAFGDVVALNDVRVEVTSGIHGIIGPNGSGKTTLLNAVSGICRPKDGRIYLDEMRIDQWNVRQRALAGISRTFQYPRLLAEETVLNNLLVGAYGLSTGKRRSPAASGRPSSGELAKRGQAWLSVLDIEELSGVLAGELSHGQKRLVEIARAMMNEPRLLLLDEPAAGLPEGDIEKLAEVLPRVGQLGVSILLVEHHLSFVTSIAERITVMDRGYVLAEGNAAEVLELPAVREAYFGIRAEPQAQRAGGET
jgi:branched-chain amino acid transport system permease protein